MKTVAVIEGFAGGPIHTRQFRRALGAAGFKVIKDRREADIVIAHSAGIYAIPVHARAKLLMLIGPTYWPGERLIKRVIKHNKSSGHYHISQFGLRVYFWKKLLEFYYFFRRHIYLWHGVFNNNRLERLQDLVNQPGRKTIIVRNHNDPFTSPNLRYEFKNKLVKWIELPGVHDDYVKNPKPYVDLLRKEI